MTQSWISKTSEMTAATTSTRMRSKSFAQNVNGKESNGNTTTPSATITVYAKSAARYTKYQTYGQQKSQLRTTLSMSSTAATTMYYTDSSPAASGNEKAKFSAELQFTQQRRRTLSISSGNDSGISSSHRHLQRQSYGEQRHCSMQATQQHHSSNSTEFSSNSESDYQSRSFKQSQLKFTPKDKQQQQQFSKSPTVLRREVEPYPVDIEVNDGSADRKFGTKFSINNANWCAKNTPAKRLPTALTHYASSKCFNAPAAKMLPKPPQHWLLCKDAPQLGGGLVGAWELRSPKSQAVVDAGIHDLAVPRNIHLQNFTPLLEAQA